MENAVSVIQKNKNQMEKEWIRHILATCCHPLKSRFLKTRTKETKANNKQANWDGKAEAQKKNYTFEAYSLCKSFCATT